MRPVVVEGVRLTARGPQAVRVEVAGDGRIAAVTPLRGARRDALPTLVPGFVDIHVHGGGGADTMDATADAFERIAATHARFGTTTLLLTTVAATAEEIDQVIAQAARSMQAGGGGARIAGVHLEGPFLDPEHAGAQRRDRIVPPLLPLASRWFATGVVRVITLAPELPGAHAVAALAREHGVVAAAGHTGAGAAELAAAAEAGFSHVTHLCNAMRPFLHRDVGPVGQVIEDGRFTADLICDGVHVHPAMVRALCRTIGTGRLLLITDAIRAAAMPDGIYDLGGLPVRLQGDQCRLADGTLAGSVLTMLGAFERVQRLADVSPYVAQRLCAENPARRIGLGGRRIAAGREADLVCLDGEGTVLWTMVRGRKVYTA